MVDIVEDFITADHVDYLAGNVAKQLIAVLDPTRVINIYGIPRGGVSAAYVVMTKLNGRAKLVDTPMLADVIIDDLLDSGETIRKYKELNLNVLYAVLLSKRSVEDVMGIIVGAYATSAYSWIVFPWEQSVEGSAEDIPRRLLQFIGEDVNRGGLLETPARFLKAWKHWTSGYKVDVAKILKVFEDGAEGCDQMVVRKDIPLYSKCEHHLADIVGTCTIAYIPDGKVLGLSKLDRLVDVFARRLQVQERLTNQIADALVEHVKPKGVGVWISARHMCVESRGVQHQNSITITSALRGCILTEDSARAEFLALARS
jgi:GTP cyclohydrolase IA